MKPPAWLVPTLRMYAPAAVGLLLFALVVWRRWPLDELVGDGGVIVWALIGLACVVGPNEFASAATLRGGGYTPLTNHESETLEDFSAVRLIGFVILLDALTGVGKWLVWTWW